MYKIDPYTKKMRRNYMMERAADIFKLDFFTQCFVMALILMGNITNPSHEAMNSTSTVKGAEMVQKEEIEQKDNRFINIFFNGYDRIRGNEFGKEDIDIDILYKKFKKISDDLNGRKVNIILPEGAIEGETLHKLIMICQEFSPDVVISYNHK